MSNGPDKVRSTGDVFAIGEHVMTVCNACRYCEQYCPVFPAMEERLTFGKADMAYLANLCHNCGECLYACQYAPPHEFGINVPKTLAEIRLQTYEDYCWPRFLGVAFRRQGLLTATLLVVGLTAIMLLARGPGTVDSPTAGSFYSVVPYEVMVTLFGGVFLFVIAALSIGVHRFRREIGPAPSGVEGRGPGGGSKTRRAVFTDLFTDVLTLRHLHGGGVDCSSGEEQRSPWRRWFHHCTFYGFMLCFASTSSAAIYHHVLGLISPYAYTSLPVVLGTAGGLGLVVGPAGLLMLRRKRDPALAGRAHDGLDESFIALLLLTSLTGLVLLAMREGALMRVLLITHLASVLALFLTLPYGKFVHGFYLYGGIAEIFRRIETLKEREPSSCCRIALSHTIHFAPSHRRTSHRHPVIRRLWATGIAVQWKGMFRPPPDKKSVLVRLRELVEALDRRVPQVEREGETHIARDADALKQSAQKRIEELEAAIA